MSLASVVERVVEPILGDKRPNSETRHRPKWWPKHFDKRWFDERLAVMDIPPYKPPYRRHTRLKAWVCTSRFHRSVIAEVDLDERTLEVDIYR